MKDFLQKLFKPVEAITAEIFLRFFGVIILLQVGSYLKADFIQQGILMPKFLFTYDFFHWVKPVSPSLMKLVLPLLFVCGLLLIIGKFRKFALILFIFQFAYLFLLEKSYFNNHFYLFLLVAFLFLFYDPKKNESDQKFYIPYWFLLLVQVQIVIVYFFGGLVKLNPDWLFRMEPMKTLLVQAAKSSAFPSLNTSDFSVYLLVYGGVIFDLSIGFLLWWKRSRKTAIILCISFHLFNFLLFNFAAGGDIGGFPVMMIGSCILFADPEKVRHRLAKILPSLNKKIPKKKKTESQQISFDKNKKAVLAFTGIYLFIQLILPLRPFLYSGHTDWTGRAGKFAWRMKLHNKIPKINFYYRFEQGDSLTALDLGGVINTMQEYMMVEDPSTFLQMADYIAADMKKSGYNHPQINASVNVSLNGRPFQPMIDSTQNLLSLQHHIISGDDWVLPFKE